jgi:predicted transposase YdaD
MAATGILAGLELTQTVIRRLMRIELMQESVIYQEILREGEARGRVEEGKLLLSKLLTRKFGNLPSPLSNKIDNLSLSQLEALTEALLDFNNLLELQQWLELV